MKKLLFKNRVFLFATIILLVVLPLSFQFSIEEGKTILSFVFLQDFPTIGLCLASSAILLSLATRFIFTQRQQIGIIVLFFLSPFTSFSIGEIPLTFIAWDFQPAIGWMYWGTGLILVYFLMRSKGNSLITNELSDI